MTVIRPDGTIQESSVYDGEGNPIQTDRTDLRGAVSAIPMILEADRRRCAPAGRRPRSMCTMRQETLPA